MSLQWMAVASFFYAEIMAVLLLCSPFISPQKWEKIFSSRLVHWLVTYGQPFFGILLLILALLFLEALWEIKKFESMEKESLLKCPAVTEHHQEKLFPAQRNLHITGFALLLSLLLRRLTALQKQQASLQDENERLLEEAEAQMIQRIAAEVSENQALREDLLKLTEELEACRKNLGRARDENLYLRKRCEKRDSRNLPSDSGRSEAERKSEGQKRE